MIDIRDYEQLAHESGAFQDIEIEILREALLLSQKEPAGPYRAVEVRDGKILAGFALMFRASNVEFTFDVTALCIDEDYQDKGIGAKLVELLSQEVLKIEKSAILRFETSSRKLMAMGEGLLPSLGYVLLGHIADFYEKGDDYFIYARHLYHESKRDNHEASEEAEDLDTRDAAMRSGTVKAGT